MYLFIFVYLKGTQQHRERNVFFLLFHFSNAPNSHNWTRLNQEPGIPSVSLTWVLRAREVDPSPAAFQDTNEQEAGSEAGWSELA